MPPLPPINLTLLLLAVLLTVAMWVDFRQQRVPNLLTLGGAALGLGIQLWVGGPVGLLAGLGGLMIGLLMLLPLYVMGGMGAGDVKLMAAVGAFLGPMNTLLAVCLTLIAGGVMALMILMTRKGAGAFLQRYGLMLRCLFTTGHVAYIPPQPGEAASGRFAYAAAIAVGTFATLVWQAP